MLEDYQIDKLKVALTSAKMLSCLVHDILDIAQVKAGKFSLNIDTFNFSQCFDNSIRKMAMGCLPNYWANELEQSDCS